MSTPPTSPLTWLTSLFPKNNPTICTSNSVIPLEPVEVPKVPVDSSSCSSLQLSNQGTDAPDSVPTPTREKAQLWKRRALHPYTIHVPNTSKRLETLASISEESEDSVLELPEILDTVIQIEGQETIGVVDHESGSVRQRKLGREKSWKDPFLVAPSQARVQVPDGSGSGALPESSSGGESRNENTKPSQYLQLYYDTMFHTGLCTYRARWDSADKKPIWRIVSGIVQKTFFWSLALLSGFQSICLAKFFLLKFIDKGDYMNFVSFAHHVACLLAKGYAVNLFALRKPKTDRMLEGMDEYESKFEDKRTGSSRWKRKLVVLLHVCTLAFGVIGSIVDEIHPDGDGIIVDSAHELVGDLYLWHSKNLTDTLNQLVEAYGTKITPSTIGFGSIVLSRDAASNIILGIVFNLVVILALVVYAYVKVFINDVKEVTDNVPEENQEEWARLQARREEVWWKYRNIRKVIGAVNDVFDPLLKLLHGGNLLLFAFFMVLCVFDNSTWVSILLYALDLVKVEVGYFVAGRIAEANDIVRAWLRNWALYTDKIKVGDKELSITIVLDELDKEPLGLGKGKFQINHTFHFKFLGLVGSVFFSMADDAKP